MPIEVAGQPTVSADPADSALDNPALRQHDEAVTVAAVGNLDFPRAGTSDGGGHFGPQWPASPMRRPMEGDSLRACRSSGPGPSLSCALAGCTMTASGRPRLP